MDIRECSANMMNSLRHSMSYYLKKANTWKGGLTSKLSITSLIVLCANMPLPLKLTDSLVAFFKNVFNTNFLSPASQIFLVALVYSQSVTSSKIFN